MSRVVVFANGALADPERVRSLFQPGDEIVCADGGSRYALALGLQPNAVIGDLDSITEADRAALQKAGTQIRQYPRDKNETDLELALRYARERGVSNILIIGALGDRLDHTLGNIAMLTDPAFAGLDVRLDDGLEEVLFCRGEARIDGSAGELVSLIPWGNAVHGVRTSGLKWPLNDETLFPDQTRGISNEMNGDSAYVHIASGLLLIVHRRQTQAQNRRRSAERIP